MAFKKLQYLVRRNGQQGVVKYSRKQGIHMVKSMLLSRIN